MMTGIALFLQRTTCISKVLITLTMKLNDDSTGVRNYPDPS
ncbi:MULTISPECIES: hypothetical protein [Dickeya]|nr:MULTISPECIES: hypothetical protein [Dickeya]